MLGEFTAHQKSLAAQTAKHLRTQVIQITRHLEQALKMLHLQASMIQSNKMLKTEKTYILPGWERSAWRLTSVVLKV